MRPNAFLSTLFLAAAILQLTGCSGDAPSQGQGIAPGKLTADLDKQLDKIEALPPNHRAVARRSMDRAIQKGTTAQKERYSRLMDGVAGGMRGPGGTNAGGTSEGGTSAGG